jgi:dihydroneopterin triphosphate diphosphatase
MTGIRCNIIEVCVFAKTESGPRYLLLKRADDETLYPGIWQLITGGIHDGEKAYNAAYREVYEETKLTAERFYTVPHVNVFYAARLDEVNVTAFFAAELKEPVDPEMSVEHAGFRWCPYEEAHELLVWPGQKRGIEIVRKYIIPDSEPGRLLDVTELIRREDNKVR